MVIPRRIIERSLARKGFRRESNRDHHYWYFWYNGQKTIIRTKISLGNKCRDYRIGLIKLMPRQLRLSTLSQTIRLLKCPMEKAEYTNWLLSTRVIP